MKFKYILIAFVTLAVLAVCLLPQSRRERRDRREHLSIMDFAVQAQAKSGRIPVGMLNNRLSFIESKLTESDSQRRESGGQANQVLGRSAGSLEP
jgi:hypothetical protein